MRLGESQQQPGKVVFGEWGGECPGWTIWLPGKAGAFAAPLYLIKRLVRRPCVIQRDGQGAATLAFSTSLPGCCYPGIFFGSLPASLHPYSQARSLKPSILSWLFPAVPAGNADLVRFGIIRGIFANSNLHPQCVSKVPVAAFSASIHEPGCF